MKIPRLHEAAQDGDVRALGEILDSGTSLETQWRGYTAIVFAVDQSQLAAFEYLLARGARIDHRDPENAETLLHLAARRGVVEMCEALIQRFVPVDALDTDRNTPLISACSGTSLRESNPDYVTVVRSLLRCGAQVNWVNASLGSTPLIEAARYGKREVCKVLLEHGADETIVSKYGETYASARDQFIASNGYW